MGFKKRCRPIAFLVRCPMRLLIIQKNFSKGRVAPARQRAGSSICKAAAPLLQGHGESICGPGLHKIGSIGAQ